MVPKIVPKEHWDIITKYLNAPGQNGVALIPEDFFNSLSPEVRQRMMDSAGEYNHCCDPDVSVELVDHIEHYFITHNE